MIANPLIIPAACLLLLGFFIISSLISATGTGFAGGLLLGLLEILSLTIYFGWLEEVLRKNRLSLHELWKVDYSLFSSIINVGFTIFIAQFFLSMFAVQMPHFPLLAVLALVIILVFNPLAETILEHREGALETFSIAYRFTMEHWIVWFIPFVLIVLPWALLHPAGPLLAMSRANPLLPIAPVVMSTQVVGNELFGDFGGVIALTGGVIFAHYFMIFRSILFQSLSSRSPRY
jgi:hypothetical protein